MVTSMEGTGADFFLVAAAVGLLLMFLLGGLAPYAAALKQDRILELAAAVVAAVLVALLAHFANLLVPLPPSEPPTAQDRVHSWRTPAWPVSDLQRR